MTALAGLLLLGMAVAWCTGPGRRRMFCWTPASVAEGALVFAVGMTGLNILVSGATWRSIIFAVVLSAAVNGLVGVFLVGFYLVERERFRFLAAWARMSNLEPARHMPRGNPRSMLHEWLDAGGSSAQPADAFLAKRWYGVTDREPGGDQSAG